MRGSNKWDSLSSHDGKEVTFHGYVASQRNASKNLRFLTLVDPYLRTSVQLCHSTKAGQIALDQTRSKDTSPSKSNGNNGGSNSPVHQVPDDEDLDFPSDEAEAASTDSPSWVAEQVLWTKENIKHISPHTPVLVKGMVRRRGLVRRVQRSGGEFSPVLQSKIDPYVGKVKAMDDWEIDVQYLIPLNSVNWPNSKIIPKYGVPLGPHERHLQFRTDSELRSRIRTRSRLMALTRKFLFTKRFDEIETPLLFKSTPEGAREFIVPTRQLGLAYALPQSPQQYKQMLMACGTHRYFQFAKCFRDEDMRADRQPEFTQVSTNLCIQTG